MAQNTGKARKAKAPSATRRLRLGLGVMLTLLLVVGGKLFLVQGLDVGGMAEAALQTGLHRPNFRPSAAASWMPTALSWPAA